MKKFWVLYSPEVKGFAATGQKYETYEAAEEHAKRALNGETGRAEIIVMEAMAVVRRPVPAAEVTKL